MSDHDPASTRDQHAAGHINRLLTDLEVDLAEIRTEIANGRMTRVQAALWLRFLVESTGAAVASYEAFALRGAT